MELKIPTPTVKATAKGTRKPKAVAEVGIEVEVKVRRK